MDVNQAYSQGKKAGLAGDGINKDPYPPLGAFSHRWQHGYRDGAEARKTESA